MAIVNGKSTLYGSTTTEGAAVAADKRIGQARMFRATGQVTNGASDSSGSTYKVIKLPSHAILLETTEFKISAWGFAQAVCGIATDTDAVFDVARTAGNQNPVTLFGATHGVELWELVGLSEDPRGEIELIMTAEAGATGAGTIDFVVDWAID